MEDIMKVDRKGLKDIDDVFIVKEQTVKKKAERSASEEGDLTTHLNEGYVVRVHFSQGNYTATDALKEYLKQIAQLKY